MPKLLLLVIVAFLVIGGTVSLKEHYRRQLVLGESIARDVKTAKLIQEVDYWQDVAAASPTYRDAYVQLALLNEQLGNSSEAKIWLIKALQIDPNWEVPTSLQSLLP